MKLTNQALGALGEEFSANWLIENGYQILDRNWRGSRVELDIVGKKSNLIIFFEVKTRRNVNCGFPAESVTIAKLENIKSAALQWLLHNKVNCAGIRIDILSVRYDGNNFALNHIQGIQ
jgi:putative endonuclease